MKAIITIITGVVVGMTLITGCSDNNSSNPLGGCNGLGWSEAVGEEVTNYSEAASAYSQDPTVQKCNVYKDALRDYYDALEGISAACIPEGTEQDYQESLAEAQQSIDEIDCSEPQGQ